MESVEQYSRRSRGSGSKELGVAMIRCVENFVSVKQFKNGVLSAVASNSALDRMGEVIMPSAFSKSLKTYRLNPVILSNHIHRSLMGNPTIIGSAKTIDVVDDELVFDMTFAQIQIAKEWESLFKDGHARAFSVGFIPLAGEMKDINDEPVYVHTEVELLEISAVGVPANPEALVLQIEDLAKVIKTAEKVLSPDTISQVRLKVLLQNLITKTRS